MRSGLAFAAGLLAGLWLDTTRRKARAERQHPPTGRFVNADGVTLHYLDRGPRTGRPVVFLHGNGILADDWALSILDRAAEKRRCVCFDRPGHGYSEPAHLHSSPSAQAAILNAAARKLGLEKPIIVGHSLGGAVALAWALDFPDEVGGLVILSAFTHPTPRADFIPFMGPAIPVVGPAMSRTVLQPLDRLIIGPLVRHIFAPNPVPESYDSIPPDLLLRPTQLEAAAAHTAALIPGVAAMAPRYPDIRCPTAIVAGLEDRIVDPHAHAVPLHDAITGSTLHLLAGTGHMSHHARPEAVLAALERVERELAAEPANAAS
ncbi:alpha/beta fold hydrolase [Azospirillum rugosum]|uniref:Pimeloyl-ACP methyl ester carboxylesterase n=1 Tax=Azospirillum rugosum TaxID=416170 RepID=A0ABS4SLJ2_9PROT|nr:alpha/beta hydrolase [Azospirillum rugosum]MBP2293431.1 pimeloyl-ACP methyl ester carboxylesterase [Azospirillum rugosum]MDQ0530202.1 pimeloyl-ACP methyl ester carboxylesterase [Azospirillum rugosum]